MGRSLIIEMVPTEDYSVDVVLTPAVGVSFQILLLLFLLVLVHLIEVRES